MKAKSPQEQLKSLVANLLGEFAQWDYLYTHGGQDPFYADGTGLYLTRNHIICCKNQIKELCEQNGFELPAEYFKDIPPEVDMHYMARADEIRKNAKESLRIYEHDENYQSLCTMVDLLNKKQRNDTCIDNVIGYAKWLKQAIDEDDLITMRRHEHCEHYLQSFADCLERVNKLKIQPPKMVWEQMSLF